MRNRYVRYPHVRSLAVAERPLHLGPFGPEPRRVVQPSEMPLFLCVGEPCDHELYYFQTFRTYTNPVSSENLKEAVNFFSASNSAPLLHTPSPPFNLAGLRNALPIVSHQSLRGLVKSPDISQQTAQPNLSGAAWASDFMNFQQIQPSSSSRQVVTTPSPVGVQNVQQPLHSPGS